MRKIRSLAQVFPRTPFTYLVAHFVRRILASDDEQGSGSISLGIGAVLAILASPGAFASIFLMDKYSTLLQWMRGQKGFDPYHVSTGDEYFFVVLSMTVTGLVMVLRWNRLFPDRRDFSNLAVLPIAVRNIFLANFLALFSLALLLGIDVNAVSSLLFPAVVTMSEGTLSAFLRIAAGHATAVFSASLFSFFAVFALVGMLMLILPKRLFRPVSICIRILLVVGLLTEFFSNLFLQLLAGRLPNRPESYMRLLPSFWFLGVYGNAAHIGKPGLAQLGHQAILALLLTVVLAIVAYSLCYRRHFLQLSESQDAPAIVRLHFPRAMAKQLFRSPFEHACNSFIFKVLFRSERHLMFFGGYLGIGLVMVAQTPLESANEIPLMVAFFFLTGLRFVFDIPAVLDANWLFRMAVIHPFPPADLVVRRLMLRSVLLWELLLLFPLTAERLGWRIAFAHTATVVALSLLLIDILLLHFRKIPFTCSSQPETKQLMARLLGSMLCVLVVVPMLAGLERWMLKEPIRFTILAVLLAFAWYYLRRYKRELLAQDRTLIFEDRPPSTFELLNLA
ncbi:MAG: hypothetical protein WB992_05065 [Bryobacteraceae bacterium]